MEEFNEWLDPESGNHKNKKSTKPDPRPAIKAGLKPGHVKTKDEKIQEYFGILLEDGLDLDLPESVRKWAIENFSEVWLEDFLSDISILKEELITSHYFPDMKQMLMLKFIFLLRQGF